MFRWGYIGSGDICRTTAKEIVGANHCIAAVWSRNTLHAQKFASAFGAKVCASLAELFNEDVDGVYIGVPHNKHAEFCLQAVKAGKPVLCEKPLAVNAEQAKEVFDAGEKSGVYVCEANWTKFNPVTERVLSWVKNGAIGEVKHVEASFCMPLKTFVKKERLFSPLLAGGALLDVGIYPVSYCLWLLGKPQSVSAEAKVVGGIDETTEATLTYSTAVAQTKCSLALWEREKCVIVGEKGKIEVPNFHCAKKAFLKTDKTEVFKTREKLYLKQFDVVAEEILSGAKSPGQLTQQESLSCLEILDEIRGQIGVKYPFE